MDTRDRIIQFVKTKGPVLPYQIAKEIGTNIIMASAHLAELTANNKMKISNIKVGGSPLYYLLGQEAMLQKYTSNLNDKDKKAFDLLSQGKILSDSEQEPVIRVALRAIKDFAVPLNVKYNDSKELFWKWYLTSDNEAETLIKSKLEITDKSTEEIATEGKAIEKVTDQKINTNEDSKIQIPKPETTKKKKIRQKTQDDGFLADVKNFFGKNKIEVVNSEIIKSNSEMDFIVLIPSVVGNLQYYCKAKNKKIISDSDLSNAYVKGLFRKLPVLYISSGELSLKAREILTRELNMIKFRKLQG